MTHDFRRLAKDAARAAAEKKALDILVLDLRAQSDVADYVVIASVESSAQMGAVEHSVKTGLEKAGLHRLHHDGRVGGRWIALDYGPLLIHVMLPQAREFYRLESLWEKPKRVHWNEAAPRGAKAKIR